MSRVVLVCLSVILGLFFCFVGMLKLTPVVNYEMHKELKKNFASQARVFPLASAIGLKVSPKLYREVVGYAEIVCGAILLLIPGVGKQIANLILLSIVTLAVYSHWMVNDRFDRYAPGIVMALLLMCRFVIYLQTVRAEKKRLPSDTDVDDKKDR